MNNKFLNANGAGYSLDKKAWHEAYDEGLSRRIIRRLRILDRPVSLAELTEKLVLSCGIPYTEDNVRARLDILQNDGKVGFKDGLYQISP